MDMSFFESREDTDGVRATWNAVPRSKLQYERNVIPLATMYTPLNQKSDVATTQEIVNCRQCSAFIHPYVEHNSEFWVCRHCGFSNRMPSQLPVALEHSSVEYRTGKYNSFAPIFFYVIDTICDDYEVLKEALVTSLSLLPANALVGVVSYGKNVMLHSFAPHNQNLMSYAFNGAKEYSLEEFRKALGLLDSSLRTSAKEPFGALGKNFLQPVELVEYSVSALFENMAANAFPRVESKERPLRATGAALKITSLLLTSLLGSYGSNGGQVLCFSGGACNYGPGKMVGNKLVEPLRSHHDIEQTKTTNLANIKLQHNNYTVDISLATKAKEFYSSVTQTLVKLGIACNYFIGSYDQVGLYEMDEVCRKTGGLIVMSDSFNTAMFKQSFIKFFAKDDDDYLQLAMNGTLEVKVEKDLQVRGLVGNAAGLPVKAVNSGVVSRRQVGEANTNCWKLCSITPQSTYAVYFDKLDSQINSTATVIQFITHYQHSSGEFRLRVTSYPIQIIQDNDYVTLEQQFDQEAGVVVIARELVHKLEGPTPVTEVMKDFDKVAVSICKRFAQFIKGDIMSFRLSQKYAFLPQFVYHLRRSPFVNVFNSSPDETSFIRHVQMHEDTNNSLIMIQPSLLSYDIEKFGALDEATGETTTEPEPVLLDSASLSKSRILLLDTFFHIVIWHGETVAAWRKAGYHEMEGYEHFREFLEAPKREAMEILVDRFPLPRFIDCDEGGSQARFLMAKLNPSSSYSSNANSFYGNVAELLTDDVSLQAFMEHIQRIVTAK